MSNFKGRVFKKLDLDITQEGIKIAMPEVLKESYLNTIHLYWCRHSKLLPVNRIKRDMELLARRYELVGFLACLLSLFFLISA